MLARTPVAVSFPATKKSSFRPKNPHVKCGPSVVLVKAAVMNFPSIATWVKRVTDWRRTHVSMVARPVADFSIAASQRVAPRVTLAAHFGIKVLRKSFEWVLWALGWIVDGAAKGMVFLLAVIYRYGVAGIILVVGLALVAGVLWAFWFKLGAPDFLTADKRDTEHANLYMAVQKQLQDAENDYKKVEAAIRAYWLLMVYEFYWWRRGMISRRLFLAWAEFREQEFRRNLSYFHPVPTPPAGATAPTPPPFENFIQGFTYCKDHNVIRAGTHFVRFMNYLYDRSQRPERPLHWFHIERFRHRSLGGWFLARP
jgi:hypothetical protein